MARRTIFAQKEITIESEEVHIKTNVLNPLTINGEKIGSYNGITQNQGQATATPLSIVSGTISPITFTATPGFTPPWMRQNGINIELDPGMYNVDYSFDVTNTSILDIEQTLTSIPPLVVIARGFSSEIDRTGFAGPDIRTFSCTVTNANIPFVLSHLFGGKNIAPGNVDITFGVIRIYKIY